MKFNSKRMQREADCVALMISRYCKDHHKTDSPPCEQCEELIRYALQRLRHCPFQEKKSTCGKCPVHCYKPDMQNKIRKIMRYIGPRMMLTNPIMAFHHLVDGLRKPPKRQ